MLVCILSQLTAGSGQISHNASLIPRRCW